jgi:hypothetical protein
VLVIEVGQLPLFARAFGLEITALLAVRLLLTATLVVLFVRRSTVARMILGALRVMAFCVAFIMAVGLTGWLAWTLGASAVIDGTAGLLLLLLPFDA